MQSDTTDCAPDRAVSWWDSHWRCMVYSFLAGVFLTMFVQCSTAEAADYTKPAGAPEVWVESHGVLVSVFAVNTAIGEGIGVFEKRSTGWTLCNFCIVSPETPNMEAEVKANGGPGPYIEAKRPFINDVLTRRYPQVMPPSSGSALDEVNRVLNSYAVRLVNGVPQLAPR